MVLIVFGKGTIWLNSRDLHPILPFFFPSLLSFRRIERKFWTPSGDSTSSTRLFKRINYLLSHSPYHLFKISILRESNSFFSTKWKLSKKWTWNGTISCTIEAKCSVTTLKWNSIQKVQKLFFARHVLLFSLSFKTNVQSLPK